MEFKRNDIITIMIIIVETLELHFDKNDNFPGFSS